MRHTSTLFHASALPMPTGARKRHMETENAVPKARCEQNASQDGSFHVHMEDHQPITLFHADVLEIEFSQLPQLHAIADVQWERVGEILALVVLLVTHALRVLEPSDGKHVGYPPHHLEPLPAKPPASTGQDWSLVHWFLVDLNRLLVARACQTKAHREAWGAAVLTARPATPRVTAAT